MVYIYDLEVYPNLFVGVFQPITEKTPEIYIVWEVNGKYIQDDRQALFDNIISKRAKLVGYNNLKYDSQILHYMWMNQKFTTKELKEFSNQAIDSKWPIYKSWEMMTIELDLFKIWHYDNPQRRTSLKWLEFMLRFKTIKDLPYEHDKQITLESQKSKIVAYCKHDVAPTKDFFELSKDKILHRQKMRKRFGINFINLPDSTMGERLILHEYCKAMNLDYNDIKTKRTQRKQLVMKDLVFDFNRANYPILQRVLKEYFDPMVLKSFMSNNHNRIFDFKSVPKFTVHYGDLEIVYGMGGIHGCVPKGVYKSTDSHVIKSCDVKGEYPHTIIHNNLYPEHLGPEFISVYEERIVKERDKYPKDTHLEMNNMYKLGSNAAYGKTNSEHSALYDPKRSATITINGQLSKTMLAEMLMEAIPTAKILMMNTDGLEVIIPREEEQIYFDVCKKWEDLTKFTLEHDNYNKLIIDSVNHYIGIYDTGKIKRKGSFYIWEDYEKFKEYHKNASATIIPEAINEYFVNGTPVSDTINNCNDIYKFLYGVKKTKAFSFVILQTDKFRRVSYSNKINDRVLRYYACTENWDAEKHFSGSLYKLWNDGRLTALQKDTTVRPLQSIKQWDATKYTDINRQWYIDEAYKIINNIENAETL